MVNDNTFYFPSSESSGFKIFQVMLIFNGLNGHSSVNLDLPVREMGIKLQRLQQNDNEVVRVWSK